LDLPPKRECLEEIKPYVPGKPVEEVKREYNLEEVIKLASNENPLGPSPRAQEAMRESVEEVSFYPDGNCYRLKRILTRRMGVDQEELIIGNGSDELLKLLAETYINPGDEAVMPQPSFSEYDFAMKVMGGISRFVPLRSDFEYDLEAMLEAVNERTRLVFLCNPNNPTGTFVNHRNLSNFIKKLPRGVIVVVDEAYCEYASDPYFPHSLELLEGGHPLLVLRTFSKIYGLAGLRIGYGIGSKQLIADMQRVREPFNVNHMAQVAAAAALEDDLHLARSRNLVEEGRRQVALGLEEMGLYPVPSQANFFFVNIGVDSREAFPLFLKRGIVIRTGDIFGYPNYIRVNFGTLEQNQLFLDALKEVREELGVGEGSPGSG